MSALEIADIIGIISFSISGFLIAVHHKLGILGIIVTSFLTALGGGLIRDVISNKIPYIFTQNLPIIIVACTVFFAIFFKLNKIADLEGKSLCFFRYGWIDFIFNFWSNIGLRTRVQLLWGFVIIFNHRNWRRNHQGYYC